MNKAQVADLGLVHGAGDEGLSSHMARGTSRRQAGEACRSAPERRCAAHPTFECGVVNVGDILIYVHHQHRVGGARMSVTQIDIDDDALERAMALAKVRTKKEAVNLALHFYAEQQERAARISRHFERAREWGAVEDAERLHRAEKHSR
jgi:Arc/MetJ family transcription regulator